MLDVGLHLTILLYLPETESGVFFKFFYRNPGKLEHPLLDINRLPLMLVGCQVNNQLSK